MARFIFEGLTEKQAIVFADWYSGQGEQNADYWFDEWCEDGTPMTKGPHKVLENGDVVVQCR
jgi:hypothetical protein